MHDGYEASLAAGGGASARALPDAQTAAAGGGCWPVQAARARLTAPEPGTRSSGMSPGAAPGRVKIRRHTTAGLAPITREG